MLCVCCKFLNPLNGLFRPSSVRPIRGALLYMAHIIKKWSVTNVVITSAYNGAIIRWCWETRQTRLCISYGTARNRFNVPHFSVFSPFFFIFIKSVDEKDGIGNCPGRGCAIPCRSFEGWITSPNSSSHPINCRALLLLLSLSRQFNDDCNSRGYTACVDIWDVPFWLVFLSTYPPSIASFHHCHYHHHHHRVVTGEIVMLAR